MENGEIKEIQEAQLVEEVLKLKHQNYRLIQICATKVNDGYELTYSFGQEYTFVCLRLYVGAGDEVTSISDIYEPAFLYENEIHDLFGIAIKMMKLDYHGNLYRLKEKTPYQ